ncbi:type II toxin-antitoxin system RelE/ParE family toxin [Methanogenium sp. S4BF]|uniref:type II toxin-antitoxin system RelE/ParE family toxin n=1 Tax=Methanogenium sp. S4BF TaxID=1789226 RepID=UPI0024171414|nr:type II toxin-antitoxin system RelE/ParE family toxin [Methanogenium sp. S4BF]WFN35023.1 type II toxin-antitoxin system RelE/ParE family toxin [Methanogenium sp. S4BF]
MTYRLLLDKKHAQDFYGHLPEKSRAIVRDHLLRLTDDPYPGSGADKEQLIIQGDDRYFRLHIGRSFTAFYTIHDAEGEVRVLEILTIEQAHKKYGRLGTRG